MHFKNMTICLNINILKHIYIYVYYTHTRLKDLRLASISLDCLQTAS